MKIYSCAVSIESLFYPSKLYLFTTTAEKVTGLSLEQWAVKRAHETSNDLQLNEGVVKVTAHIMGEYYDEYESYEGLFRVSRKQATKDASLQEI